MATATETGPKATTLLNVVASPAFKAWADGLAAHLRIDRSKATEIALVELAKSRGYDQPAPPRRAQEPKG